MESSYLIETLALVAGFLLSVLMEIPAIKVQYDKLTDGGKRVVMGVLLILAAAGLYGISCSAFLLEIFQAVGVTCDQPGLILLIRALGFALFANQGTFGLLFRGRKKSALAAG